MTEFFAMGGYGAYVWPAYILSALGLGGLLYGAFRRISKARRKLDTVKNRTAGGDMPKGPKNA